MLHKGHSAAQGATEMRYAMLHKGHSAAQGATEMRYRNAL